MPNIYRIEVAANRAEYDSEGKNIARELQEFGLLGVNGVRTLRVYAIAGDFSRDDATRAAREFFADAVVDAFAVDAAVLPEAQKTATIVEIRRKNGVMDPAEQSIKKGLHEMGMDAAWVRNSRKYLVAGAVEAAALRPAVEKLLANVVIEEFSIGSDAPVKEPASVPWKFQRVEVPLAGLTAAELTAMSRKWQLYLNETEMLAVQAHFAKLGRAPTDIELETIAQTWSEHCNHKTFKAIVNYRDNEKGTTEAIDNLLKQTVAKATRELSPEWCWSVFVDNSGVIEFTPEMGIGFKVETHNHPSAIEPYGGAGTGIGGCIRDPMGTGLGGKPVMNTDVFCFGRPDLANDAVPKGCLHPRRIMKGVVSGVRDYGNRMGIPTTNGAVFFDERYTGNPLVFCGNLALIPRQYAARRRPAPGEVAIVVGGGTGRDGIHGATFSSVELDENSEMVSSGAVQIGNPIEQKKVLDFLLRARDAGLYSCITDCGAGGLSSAIGEMGEECGVEVDLEKAPLKYEGLSATEIWISEAQERMVIAADAKHLPELEKLAHEENVSITPIARFRDDRKLLLRYQGHEIANLEMSFLHDGCPRRTREAVWDAPRLAEPALPAGLDCNQALKDILSAYNVCSKEWIIRQYDHEVQGASVVKPLVGVAHDAPGDAAVIAPILGNVRAVAVSNGINPKYSDIDPYWMAACAIDEALRNLVAVGASLKRCAVLDNFCWGNCDKPDRLAGLVRASKACYDFATAFGVPFVSGKDSLNNEYGVGNDTICIPGTLLVSAMAVMDDCRLAVTSDLKQAGDAVYLVGKTYDELGGSHLYALLGETGRNVPQVRPQAAKRTFGALAACTAKGLCRALHDCSEGGLAVAAAEMAFGGGLGIELNLDAVATDGKLDAPRTLFSESASRLLAEVAPDKQAEFEKTLRDAGVDFAKIGAVNDSRRLTATSGGRAVIDDDIAALKDAWQKTLANP